MVSVNLKKKSVQVMSEGYFMFIAIVLTTMATKIFKMNLF